MFKTVANTILLLSIGFTMFTGYYATGKPLVSEWISSPAIAFELWAIAPYLVLLLVNNLIDKTSNKKKICSLVMTVIVCGFGDLAFLDGFFIHSYAQNALLFIFVPVWQFPAVLLGGIIIFFLPRQKPCEQAGITRKF